MTPPPTPRDAIDDELHAATVALRRWYAQRRMSRDSTHAIAEALSNTIDVLGLERRQPKPRLSCLRTALVALTGALMDRLEECNG